MELNDLHFKGIYNEMKEKFYLDGCTIKHLHHGKFISSEHRKLIEIK